MEEGMGTIRQIHFVRQNNNVNRKIVIYLYLELTFQ